MRAESQFHQRLRIRQPGDAEAVLLLVPRHGVASLGVPMAAGRAVQSASLDQSLLDLLDPARSHLHVREARVYGGLVVGRPTRSGCFPWRGMQMVRSGSGSLLMLQLLVGAGSRRPLCGTQPLGHCQHHGQH